MLRFMNLVKTSMGHMFKKGNKIWKKDNVGVNNKYTSLLKKDLLKKIFRFRDWLDRNKPKNMQIFSYLKYKFWHM